VIGLSQAIVMLLAILLAGLVPSEWLIILPGIALLALMWSFGRDAWQQVVSARS
jgi:hypothetical protein